MTDEQVKQLLDENSKTTMDIYAKIKYNKPRELLNVVNAAFHQVAPN